MTTIAGPIRHDRYRFCPACGAALELQRLRPDEPKRLVCSKCSGVVYLDPKVVTCVILEIGDKILLMRRKRPDDSHKWLLPGGYVDEGEPVEQAAIREIREEVKPRHHPGRTGRRLLLRRVAAGHHRLQRPPGQGRATGRRGNRRPGPFLPRRHTLGQSGLSEHPRRPPGLCRGTDLPTPAPGRKQFDP
jgi:hypothetical protein